MIEGSPMFATRLRAIMAERDVTQERLAAHLGYTQTAISYWCAGKRQPSLEDLVRVAGTFDVTTDYLLGLAATRGVPRDDKAVERVARVLLEQANWRWRWDACAPEEKVPFLKRAEALLRAAVEVADAAG